MLCQRVSSFFLILINNLLDFFSGGILSIMENNNIRVIKKTLLLLSFLARKNSSAGVTEIAAALEMPKATVHRILATLLEDNVVLKNDDGRYRIGPTVLLWGSGFKFNAGIIDLAQPFMMRLRDESRETVHLSVYNKGVAQYAERYNSPQNVTLRWSKLGSELPLYCTAAGRAIMSRLPAGELDAYLEAETLEPRTAKTVVDRDKLRELLSIFRKQGWAWENEENEEDIRCVGAAIIDHTDYPVAALSLTAPTFRFSDEDSLKFGEKLAAAARAISRMI